MYVISEDDEIKRKNSLDGEPIRQDPIGTPAPPKVTQLTALSDQMLSLESLWETLSQCLLELEHTPDHHAVLVLQVTKIYHLVSGLFICW